MKFLIILSSYPISDTALHPHFYTHLICPNKCLPNLHSKMSMMSSELETMLAIKFLEKGSTSGYPMIIDKIFESMFDGHGGDVKLKILNN